jgi:ATP-binding cassette subfamily C protein CydD
LVLTVALGELSGLLLIAQTGLLVAIVDGVVTRGRGLCELAPLFAALLGAIAARAAAAWASRRAGFECASAVKRSLRGELLRGLERLGPTALARLRSGSVAEVAVDAVESLEGYYSGYLPQRAVAVLVPFTVLAAIFPLDRLSALVLLLTAAFLPLSMIAVGAEAHERNQRLWSALARASGRFLDSLRGLATVKIFGAARREMLEIERSSEEYRLATMSVLRIAFVSSLMLELIGALSIAIVAVLAGVRLLAGRMAFSSAYFVLLVAPEYFLCLRSLGTQYHARMRAASAAEQIRELLGELSRGPKAEAAASKRSGVSAPAMTRRPGASLSFEEVRFGYLGKPIIENLSFSLAAGGRLALVGPSGSGKSTLLRLILGFAEPERGSLAFDGRPLGLVPRDELYSDIAWLPQRPTIFRGSLRYNIGLGREGASGAEIDRASRMARVEEFAEALPQGLDSLVGEGGQELSSGQAQRLALARLFLRSPRLLLLDEPTAHLDPTSERLVNAAIEELAEGRSMILVTHRPLVEGMPSLRLEGVP